MRRTMRTRRKLAAVLTAGMCFQSVQCAIDPNQLGVQLLQTIGSLFISDYVNNLFDVQPSPF